MTAIKEESKQREAALVEAEKRLHYRREEVNKKHREFIENALDYPLRVRVREREREELTSEAIASWPRFVRCILSTP